MYKRPLPKLKELEELLNYNEETGKFYWKQDVSRRKKAGDEAGGVSDKGYIVIGIKGVVWFAHRLAYLFSTGDDPGDNVIDHIDCDRQNNRIDNLRLLDHGPNVARGFSPKCCVKQASGRYQAVFTLDGKKNYLGTYDTEEEASKVGKEARRKARGFTHV